MQPEIESFFDSDTCTWTHLIRDHRAAQAVIIDPVLDFDAASASISMQSADRLLALLAAEQLDLAWILETHAHADHLSAGDYLRGRTGARIAIGRGIVDVQRHFKAVFGLGDEFAADGSQFDRLLDDGDTLPLGDRVIAAIATPGHTADSLSYHIGDALFVGDTVFAPDVGTARCDFPGGDAATLFASIQKLYALPENTRVFLCHDYPPPQRSARAEFALGAIAGGNRQLQRDTPADDFIAFRKQRDASLSMPRLILPALQVNIRAGALPDPDANGTRYLRLPLRVP